MIVWNTHSRIGQDICEAHAKELTALSPPTTISSPLVTVEVTPKPHSNPPDLDTPDELAVRSLLLGIVHRTAGKFAASREYLQDALQRHKTVKISTWIGGVASFELAVLDLKEADATLGGGSGMDRVLLNEQDKASWLKVLKDVGGILDQAMSLSPQSIDMSSRLDSRIMMLRDEMATKREMVENA